VTISELSVKTYGMEEAISAMERATNATKQHGINHPKTNPTWPPIEKFKVQYGDLYDITD
jgi:hypothetical protein